MALNAAAKNAMLDHLGTLVLYGSLHTADPDPSGGSEVSGGSPAYARKAITWAAAASGSMAASNTPVFDVPASTTITYFALWSAVTTGTYYGMAAITSETYGGQGTYTATSITLSQT